MAVAHVLCNKAVCGALTAAILACKKLIGHLNEWDFEMNHCVPCCWNEEVSGKQLTAADIWLSPRSSLSRFLQTKKFPLPISHVEVLFSAMSTEQQVNPNLPWSYVRFDTSIGSFVVELYHRHTPRTCYNIAALANAGYYDGEFIPMMGDGFSMPKGVRVQSRI